jgi:RNA-directed DNA polymerase
MIKYPFFGRVKSLLWLLTHSFTAKFLAVKRVTENKDKKTPGIDGANSFQ